MKHCPTGAVGTERYCMNNRGGHVNGRPSQLELCRVSCGANDVMKGTQYDEQSCMVDPERAYRIEYH